MISAAPVSATRVGAVLLVCAIVRYISYKLSVRGKLPIAPKSEASWWLGHDYLVAKNEVGVEYGRWARMLRPVFRIKSALWQDDVHTPTIGSVKSPAFQPVVVKVVGRGVVWAEGDEYKFQRKMVSPAFSISAVKKMAPRVITCVERLIQRMQRDCKNGGVFNMCDYIPAVTLDIIGAVGFGYDFGPESPEGKAILDAWHTDVALFSSFAGFLAPIVIGVAPWITKLPIKELTEDSTAKKVIHQVGRKMLQEPPNLDGTDMFSILVRESWQGKLRPDAQRRLDDATLLDNVRSVVLSGLKMLSAGSDFELFLILHQHAEVQKKLRQEILAADSSDLDVIETLRYLDAVTRGSLRLHPSARDTHRIAIHDVIPLKKPVILSNGETLSSLPVQAGEVRLHYPLPCPERDPTVWGPDADQFIPERWLKHLENPQWLHNEGGSNPPADELPHGPWGNVSNFVDGPRHCIGWRLSVQEIKLITAAIVKNFELKDTGATVKRFISPAVQPFTDGKAAHLPLGIVPW
ncbi:cytochrome P450 [Mycena capillaripes]|nr:cytochrome P450 [Mycena capillaripes]